MNVYFCNFRLQSRGTTCFKNTHITWPFTSFFQRFTLKERFDTYDFCICAKNWISVKNSFKKFTNWTIYSIFASTSLHFWGRAKLSAAVRPENISSSIYVFMGCKKLFQAVYTYLRSAKKLFQAVYTYMHHARHYFK